MSEKVELNQSIAITEACLSRTDYEGERKPGRFAGKIEMEADFDAPLLGEEIAAWEGIS